MLIGLQTPHRGGIWLGGRSKESGPAVDALVPNGGIIAMPMHEGIAIMNMIKILAVVKEPVVMEGIVMMMMMVIEHKSCGKRDKAESDEVSRGPIPWVRRTPVVGATITVSIVGIVRIVIRVI